MAEKFKTDEVIAALIKAQGIITGAAVLLKCSRATVHNYINRHATVKKAYEEANEENIDFVEQELMKAIQGGNVTAMIFFLKTKGKTRGYVERKEYAGPDGKAIPISGTPLPDYSSFDLSKLSNEELETFNHLFEKANAPNAGEDKKGDSERGS